MREKVPQLLLSSSLQGVHNFASKSSSWCCNIIKNSLFDAVAVVHFYFTNDWIGFLFPISAAEEMKRHQCSPFDVWL